MAALKVGEKAPEFTLKSAEGKDVQLKDLLKPGKYLIIAFFPAAFSSTCSDEMGMFQEFYPQLQERNANIVGISVDNHHSLQAFAESLHIGYPLLSDFHPKGKVAASYGVMRDTGSAGRALFIVDAKGVIRYSYVSPTAENPGVDRLFDALDGMASGSKS
jgi:peroxiredoxin